MENYSKGRNIEEPLSRENIPIPQLPGEFKWMHVNAGSKMRNLLTPALKAFREEGVVVWSGSGLAIGKTISCCEIMKRTFRQAHQITKICSRRYEEHWDPKLENLDPLVVIREVPTIHILLSREPLNKDEPGYQPPGSQDVFWKATEQQKQTGNFRRKSTTPRLSTEQFAALGLQMGGKKAKSNSGKEKKKREEGKQKMSQPGQSQGSPEKRQD